MPSFLFKMPNAPPEEPRGPEERAAIEADSSATASAVLHVVVRLVAVLDVALAFFAWSGGRLTVPSLAVHAAILAASIALASKRGVAAIRRRPTAIGLLFLTPSVAAVGGLLGSTPGPRAFAWLYLLGSLCSVFLVPIRARIGITLGLVSLAAGAYVWAGGPAATGSPELPAQISFLAFAVAMGVGNGHFVHWVAVEMALQRLRLGRRRREVAGLHRELESRVDAQRAELTALTGHLEQIRDRERLTLGREIRAELAPELERLRVSLGSGAAADADLSAAEEAMERAHAVFRRILHRLHPLVLKQLGLHQALRWLGDDAAKRCGVPLRLEVELADRPRSEHEDRVVFDAVQNALTRAEAVGPPVRWACRVTSSADSIVVEFHDDLTGVAGDPVGTVLLVGLRESVAAEGGSVSWSRDASGGRLRAEIPVRSAS